MANSSEKRKLFCLDESMFLYIPIIIITLILCLVFRVANISGDSMNPTFHDGDKTIIVGLFYTPERGDVIVFNGEKEVGYNSDFIVKRIIALEGDTVKIEDGILYVKEAGSDEFFIVNYVDDTAIPYYDMNEITVPEGEMFVMGDNLINSLDSRDPKVGTIDTDAITGKVILRFYSSEDRSLVFDTNFTNNDEK